MLFINGSSNPYFDGSVNGGFQYGGGLEIMPMPGAGVEFTYLRLDSKAPMEYYDGRVKYSDFDVSQNWLFLSFNKYVPVNPKIEPYAGMQLGMDILGVTNPDNQNETSAPLYVICYSCNTLFS